jgi:hypothetical protein
MREESISTVKRVGRDRGGREKQNFIVNHGRNKIKMIPKQLRMFGRCDWKIFWAIEFFLKRIDACRRRGE